MTNAPPKRAPVAVNFKNHTSEPFEWTWDGVLYQFAPLSSTMLQDYLAEHFAKHLTDKVMNELGIPTNHFTRPQYYNKCFDGTEMRADNETKLEQEIMNTSTSEITPKVKDAAELNLPVPEPIAPKFNCWLT